jgi:FkbM family methyltransferase
MKKINKHGLIWNVREKDSDEIIVGYVPGPVEYFDFLDIKKGDVVLDIGMNIGAFAVKAASLGAKVIGYEPEPETYKVAIMNFKENNLEGITHNLGVAGIEQEAKLYLDVPERNYSGFNTTVKGGLQGEDFEKSTIDIKLVGINEVLKKYKPNKVKIDCEGAEWDIIMAVHNWYNVERLTFECHCVPNHRAMVINHKVYLDDDEIYRNALKKKLREHFKVVEEHPQCKNSINCKI